jgi:hypothetical protein
MKTENSFPYSQGPAISPYPEPDQSSLSLPSSFFKINFNSTLHLLPNVPRGLFPAGYNMVSFSYVIDEWKGIWKSGRDLIFVIEALRKTTEIISV